MIRHGVLHLFLRESGWWQQRRVGDPRAARRFYRESSGLQQFSAAMFPSRATGFASSNPCKPNRAQRGRAL
jgi:hypothetical protein